MLTPKEYAFADAKLAAAMGSPPRAHGLLFCADENGQHWTAASTDVEYVEMLVNAGRNARRSLEVPPEKFPLKRRGWPDEWPQGMRKSRGSWARASGAQTAAKRPKDRSPSRDLLQALRIGT